MTTHCKMPKNHHVPLHNGRYHLEPSIFCLIRCSTPLSHADLPISWHNNCQGNFFIPVCIINYVAMYATGTRKNRSIMKCKITFLQYAYPRALQPCHNHKITKYLMTQTSNLRFQHHAFHYYRISTHSIDDH